MSDNQDRRQAGPPNPTDPDWPIPLPEKQPKKRGSWGLVSSLALHTLFVTLCLIWPERALDVRSHDPVIYQIDLVSLMGVPGPAQGDQPEDVEEDQESGQGEASEEILISPIKDDELAALADNATQVVHPADSIFFGDGVLKQGNEIRLSLRAIATYDFTEADYVGHYRFRNEDRYISILDGREQYGRLILYDSRTGIVRALTEKSRFIYTYSDTTFGEEPVAGSITFMPKQPEVYDGVITPSKLLWISDEAAAKVGFEVQFDEQPLTIQSDGATLEAALVMLQGNSPKPAVVLSPEPGCRPQDANLRFARFLALHDTAVLVMDMRGCGQSTDDQGRDWQTAGLDAAAQDLLSAVNALRDNPAIDPQRVGIWARDTGALPAIRAAELGDPDFIVATSAAWPHATPATPPEQALSRVPQPLLWILSGPDPEDDWRDFLRTLTAAPNAEAVLLPHQDAFSQSVATDEMRETLWLRELSPEYADIALPWIAEH